MSPSPADSPRALLLPYALPYLCYVGLGSLIDVRSEPLQLYGARALVVGAALVFFMRFWLPLRGPKPLAGSVALGAVVGLSLIRELGPVLTALLATGRAGSATTAEIGRMPPPSALPDTTRSGSTP